MTGFLGFEQQLQNLRISTEILEALDWDNDKLECFMEELKVILAAAPPNIPKALFWIRSTPWDCFDHQVLPTNVYVVLEKHFLAWEKKIKEAKALHKTGARRTDYRFNTSARNDYDDEWN